MKIALIAGEKGIKCVGSGINSTINRLYKYLKKGHEVKLIYGNYFLPNILGYLPFGQIKGYDLVHAGAPEFAAFISSSAPIITTFYDDGMCQPSIYLKFTDKFSHKLILRINKEIVKFLIKRGLHNCMKVIAISEQAKRGAINSFGVAKEKIAIIPPGIDTDVFKPMKVMEKNTKLILFFCGGISKKKGIDLLLKAVKILEKEKEIELWLAGMVHPMFPLKKILAKSSLISKVRYFGFVSNKKLNQLYNESDIFVMPSRFEGYGVPPLEALTCGTKVVCSLMPSIEPFKKFVTITKLTPKAIAENILKAYKKQIDFKQARAKIEKDYSVQAIGASYLKIYKEMLYAK